MAKHWLLLWYFYSLFMPPGEAPIRSSHGPYDTEVMCEETAKEEARKPHVRVFPCWHEII